MDPENIHSKKNFFLTVPSGLLVIILILLILNLVLNVTIIRLNAQNTALKKDLETEHNQNVFRLLSPTIAWLSVDEFLKQQNIMIVSLSDLKPKIFSQSTANVKGNFGIYLEDLTTGAWLGINEKEKFVPASLLKLPVMIAVLKKIEKNELSLDGKIKLEPADINLESGSLGFKDQGYEISLRDLLKLMIKESDNTADLTFVKRLVTSADLSEVITAMGLPGLNSDNRVSPKEYSNMLRGLYYSSYLKRQFSELALSLMQETDFNSQLPAGIPKSIPISHKVGMFKEGGYYHDCGIVYFPEKPYILCVMSINSTQEEADYVISSISKEVYNYMTEKLNLENKN